MDQKHASFFIAPHPAGMQKHIMQISLSVLRRLQTGRLMKIYETRKPTNYKFKKGGTIYGQFINGIHEQF